MKEKDKEIKKKATKKKTKGADKQLIIIVSVCVGFALAIVLAVVLPEPIMSVVELKKTVDKIEAENEWSVLVTDPTRGGEDPLLSLQCRLEGEAGNDFADKIENMLKNVKYGGVDNAPVGIWKIKIVLYNATEEQTVYIDDKGLYVEYDGKIFKYVPQNDAIGDFDSLYFEVKTLLGEE